MKSKYLLYTAISLFAGSLLTSSCKKILQQEPRNSTYDQVFWQNARDCQSAIAGNYALLRAVMASGTYNTSPRYYMYGDAVAPSYLTLQYRGDGLEAIQSGDITGAYNLNSLANWTKYYKAIAMSNIIISKMPGITNQQLSDVTNPVRFRKEIIGQALFIRALCYFMMTRVWGDVPIVTAVEDPITAKHLARNPKAEVLKQVENDCHEAAKNLNWGYLNPSAANVTANKGSVYALLAHLYLWRATMSNVLSNTPDLVAVNSADTTINEIVDKGGYVLTDTAQYYKTFVGKSTEGIFEISASDDVREGSNRSIANLFLREDYLRFSTTDSRAYVPTSYLNSHFAKSSTTEGWVWNESLRIWAWKTISTTVTDTKDLRYRKNFTDVATARPTCIKYHNVVYRNPSQQTDAYVSNNTIVFRLSDINLLKAEIAIYKNDLSEAIKIINNSKKKNGADVTTYLAATLTKDQVMDGYILERGRELYLEGHIFYDLLRTRKYQNYVSWLTTSRFNQEGFYWPVDPALFSNNNLMTQTNYWRGKI